MNSLHRALIGFVALAIALLGALSSVAARADQTGRNWQVQAGGATADTSVANMAFYPGTITIDVGDSITWTFVGDAHTVTFLSGAPQPSPLSPAASAPAGGNTYDGTGIVSSGIVVPVPGQNTYTLTFTKAGTFPYVCLLHPGMVGTVVVQPAGTPYPKTQGQYSVEAAVASQQDLAAGVQAMDTAAPGTSKNADGSTNYKVWTGDMAGNASVMRFLPNVLTIAAGDTVTWTNPDVMEPHTVTFAPDGNYPEFPSPKAIAPAGGSTYDGSTFTNSGLIINSNVPAPQGIPTTTSYTLKFTKPGVYTYHCLLHDFLGMIGKIRVVGGPVTSSPTPLVKVSVNSHLGPILTDAQGHTLYFLTSELGGAPSQCTGACLGHWFPLTVPGGSNDAVEGPGVTGVLSINTRADGINQVNYGEEPLYTFVGDTAPGDIHGQGIHAFGGVWLAAQVTAFPLATAIVTREGNGTASSFVVSFASSQPGQGEVYFGPSCSALVEVATQDATSGTTVHTVQVTGNEMPGTVGNNGIQPGTTYFYKTVTMSKAGTQNDDNNGACYSITIPKASS